MTDPVPHPEVDERLLAADVDARRPAGLGRRLGAVAPMTAEGWDALAVEDLSEAETEAFWQALTA